MLVNIVIEEGFVALSGSLEHFGLFWQLSNRPFSYSAKEPGSSVIFIHFYTRGSIEWR